MPKETKTPPDLNMSRKLEIGDLKRKLQEMDDYDFEHFVADLWEIQGWSTIVEQQSNDAGVDVRATKESPYPQKHLIQAKRYGKSTKIGGPDIQQYASLKQQEQGVDSVVIVTTSSFTASARDRARDLNVKLVNGNDIVSLIEDLDAHYLVEEYLDIEEKEPQQIRRKEGKSGLGTSSSDQITVLHTRFADIEYERGSTPKGADLEKTLSYYGIWTGIICWTISAILVFSGFASFPVFLLAVVGWILTPVAITLDIRNIGTFSWAEPGLLIGVIGSAIPIIGIIPVAMYLTQRRGMYLDVQLEDEVSEDNLDKVEIESDIADSDLLLDPELLEGMVNVEKRREIIETHYDDVSQEQADIIAQVLEQQMTSYELSQHEAKKKVRNQTGLDRDRVETIFWTERSSIQFLDTIRRYEDELSVQNVSWMGPGDNDVFPACKEVEKEVESRGGSVPIPELKSLLEEKAEKYEELGGTPERMDHWVPHEECRYAISPAPQ